MENQSCGKSSDFHSHNVVKAFDCRAWKRNQTKQLFFNSSPHIFLRFVIVRSFVRIFCRELFQCHADVDMTLWFLVTYDFARVNDTMGKILGKSEAEKSHKTYFIVFVMIRKGDRDKQHLKRLWFNFPSCSSELVFHSHWITIWAKPKDQPEKFHKFSVITPQKRCEKWFWSSVIII